MKRSAQSLVITSLVVLAFLTVVLTPAFAEDSSSSGTVSTKTQKIETKEQKKLAQLNDRKTAIDAKIELEKQRVASRAAALKAKLQQFKDKRKADLTQKISDNLNKINNNHTKQMDMRLDKMSDILNRVEARATASASLSGDASTAITNAQTALAAARETVATQSAKDYTVTITSETSVKSDVKSMRDKLQADLKATNAQVVAAKQAIANAIRAIASTKQETKEATTSGQ